MTSGTSSRFALAHALVELFESSATGVDSISGSCSDVVLLQVLNDADMVASKLLEYESSKEQPLLLDELEGMLAYLTKIEPTLSENIVSDKNADRVLDFGNKYFAALKTIFLHENTSVDLLVRSINLKPNSIISKLLFKDVFPNRADLRERLLHPDNLFSLDVCKLTHMLPLVVQNCSSAVEKATAKNAVEAAIRNNSESVDVGVSPSYARAIHVALAGGGSSESLSFNEINTKTETETYQFHSCKEPITLTPIRSQGSGSNPQSGCSDLSSAGNSPESLSFNEIKNKTETEAKNKTEAETDQFHTCNEPITFTEPITLTPIRSQESGSNPQLGCSDLSSAGNSSESLSFNKTNTATDQFYTCKEPITLTPTRIQESVSNPQSGCSDPSSNNC